MTRKYSEYDPRPHKRAVTASDQLRSVYQTGDASGTKKPDDGSTFTGLLSRKELEDRRDDDV